jgi:hypothetical protein
MIDFRKLLVQKLGETAQAGLRAVAVAPPAPGRRRSSKASCTPCEAHRQVMKAKQAARKVQL